ncbi:MAG: hypothetical protein JWS12_577 [Candidatus Saccharibacteria bacterium]|nr:hypothetical protein [Candidatus Saccharibacteria bacterium]
MDADKEAIQLLEDLKRLSQYSADLLAADNIRPETLYTRKAYIYSQFIFSLSLMDGIITLAQQGQARSMVPLVRALWEGWAGVAFVYAGNSHVWTYYLQLQEELKNKKKRDDLYAAGKVEDVARYKQRNKEAAKIITAINRRYKELPLVPGVITAKERSLTKRKISLKEKCQIIDHYQSLRANYSATATTLAEWYESVYSHLSGTAHVSVTELNALYKYDNAGNLHVDISGGGDRNYLRSLLLIAYLYH